MPVEILMPKLSDTMEEGKILRWLVKVGDAVRIGDVIAEVETDKANMEMEAYDEGTLAEVRVAEGGAAPVGAVVAVLDAPGEETSTAKTTPADATRPAAGKKTASRGADKAKPAAQKAKPAAAKAAPTPAAPRVRTVEPLAAAPDGEDRVRASPLARRMASEHAVDLRTLRGSGPGGRIVERDVQAALGREDAPAPERPPAPPAAATPAAGARRAAPAAGRVELTRIQRTTAKRMGEAKREVPHFYASAEIAMDEAVRLKTGLAALGGNFEGITFTHLVLRAVGLALRRVPGLNASYDGDGVVLHEEVNVGIATAVADGLVVPVLHGCDRLSLATIVSQVRGLVERARAGRFAGDDLTGGTFTVSNLGMLPVSEFAAVINPPQAAILAVSTVREVPVVRDGRIEPGRTMTVTLSSDHRIVDGMLAGRFLAEVKALLEQPLALLV